MRVNHNQRQRRKNKNKNVQVKIGHGGTLDPLATGVLIAGIGKGTKVLQSFLECTKQYETVVLFGASTDTYDRVGRVLKKAPYDHITKEMVEKALEPFRGKIMQRPPLYSALKMNGKPLYEYAREGREIPKEIQKRPVEVVELELIEFLPGGTHDHKWPTDEAGQEEKDVAEKVHQLEKKDAVAPVVSAEEVESASKKRKLEETQDDIIENTPASKRPATEISADIKEVAMSGGLIDESAKTNEEPPVGPPAARIRMTVTSGFYVRSLCQDIGEAVGSEAMMAELVRTRQGKFELGKNVLEYEDLQAGESVWAPKVEKMLADWADSDAPSNNAKKPEENEELVPESSEKDVEVETKSEEKQIVADTSVEAKKDGEAVNATAEKVEVEEKAEEKAL